MAEARRTFGPVVLLGLLAAAALAFAGSQPWFGVDDTSLSCEAPCVGISIEDAGTVPAANALALVALACWGVVLVTRGRFRRVVSILGLLTAAGALVSVVVSYPTIPDDVREVAERYSSEVVEVGPTGWYWIGAVAAVGLLVAWLAAVRFVGQWPEMGRRYDAPADAPPDDLWKAIDQGHDPTS